MKFDVDFLKKNAEVCEARSNAGMGEIHSISTGMLASQTKFHLGRMSDPACNAVFENAQQYSEKSNELNFKPWNSPRLGR